LPWSWGIDIEGGFGTTIFIGIATYGRAGIKGDIASFIFS
jgi:hypothetical protein